MQVFFSCPASINFLIPPGVPFQLLYPSYAYASLLNQGQICQYLKQKYVVIHQGGSDLTQADLLALPFFVHKVIHADEALEHHT